MTLPVRTGRIEVVTGPMFSGKGDELARRVRVALAVGLRVHLAAPSLGVPLGVGPTPTRTGAQTTTPQLIDRAEDLLRGIGNPDEIDLVAVDNVHFLGAGIVEMATHLAERGAQVVLAGTDTDFRGEPFGLMGHLLCIAEGVHRLEAICALCRAPASRTQRITRGRPAHWESPVILPGGSDYYQPRCRRCFVVPRYDEHQVSLL